MKKTVELPEPVTTSENGRGERIRTSGPCLPKAVLLRETLSFRSSEDAVTVSRASSINGCVPNLCQANSIAVRWWRGVIIRCTGHRAFAMF